MVGPPRPPSTLPTTTRRSGLRQPVRRAGSAAPERHAPPGVSTPSVRSSAISAARAPRSPEKPGAASRRKEKDFDREVSEDTSIHVVVRCRGRSDREVKENNGVVLSTPEGVKGKTLDLSMGPNAVSNKTYAFDKVFSPAADQTTVYEDVVVPVLDEVSIVAAY
jgi:kinesin family protein 11